jgi:5-methylcytosine-specific restriction endonuclease McrA
MTATQRKKARSSHQPTGRWIRNEKRLAINLRDRFTCVYCLRDLHGAAASDVTLDHVKAKADGGSNDASNLVTACRACNCARQDKPVSRFASPEAIAHIRRNTRRSLVPYVKLAKAILAGECGDTNA